MGKIELKVENAIKDEKLEELASHPSDITEERIEKSLNYNELSNEEKKAIDEFNEKLDVVTAALEKDCLLCRNATQLT